MITISLPMPDRRLSLNGREHWRTVAKLRADQHELAYHACRDAMFLWTMEEERGYDYPLYRTEKVSVSIDVERKMRGHVWDTAGIVEACKGYCDGFNEVIYTDDTQIRSFAVRWDAKPTGNGLIHLYVRALSEPQDWPTVAWATEEWR